MTDCKRCHDASDWMPNNFDHNTTTFPLEGRHAEIECIDCHKPIVQNGKSVIEYKIEKFECLDCHQ